MKKEITEETFAMKSNKSPWLVRN